MPVVPGSFLMGIMELDFGDAISFLFTDCNIGSDFWILLNEWEINKMYTSLKWNCSTDFGFFPS